MSSNKVIAPITASQRRQLVRDAADLKAAARRKGVTLDAWDESRESMAAKMHFELGCWLFYYSRKVGMPGGFRDRVDCVRRLFEAGITQPGYRFFTVFDFGERQFDKCIEMDDGDAVVNALVQMAEMEPEGRLAASVREMGWEARSEPQGMLFAA